MKQRSIAKQITTTGIGLHSGKEVTLSFCPSEVNTGIIFERIDLQGAPKIHADRLLVQDTLMSSNLVQGEVRIGTVEHLLSAVAALGIDNIIIQVSAAEIPIMDGSANPFIPLLMQAGITEQDDAKKFLKITQPVRVEWKDTWAELLPYQGFQLNFEIDFSHPAFEKKYQMATFEFSSKCFIKEISKARTFGFLKDIEQLHKNNLALGGSLQNAIVLDEQSIMNEEGLRYPDEFVRHKILDAVGDLYLAGYPLLAKFNAYKSGHAINNKLIRKVFENKNCFEIVTFDDKNNSPIEYDLPNLTV